MRSSSAGKIDLRGVRHFEQLMIGTTAPIAPLDVYSYATGAGGAGASVGANGNAGAAGGSGLVVVEEYYQ